MIIILWYNLFGKSGWIGGDIEVFIKAFLYANTEDESMKIITDILSPLNIETGKIRVFLSMKQLLTPIIYCFLRSGNNPK